MNISLSLPRRSSTQAQTRTPRVVAMLNTWRQRRALKRLDACMLADIGLTPQDVSAELERPIWDVPSHWRA